ncbi:MULTISPECIES: S-layer homology domain-containing protein [unclassified Paenibacillus]|uniref:S-layer homology domain-containing protein n=1 Tax=unclassified Paenibacillus TaxID=185978 RepID=UPI00362640B3
MKKSLSMILSLAVAFSMFSSVALAANAADKTSKDFTDLKDLDAATRAQFDAMISAGIFDGVADNTFGLTDKMNRAQFAKVAALVFGLNVDSTLKTSSFTDVLATDPANGYALPYIEAIVKAGITDGFAPGQYNPAGEVTKEQLAAFLVRGLGMDAQAKTTTGKEDKTVSTWAKGYVALAIEKKLLAVGADGMFGGMTSASRELLVTSSYAAKQQYVKAPENGLYAINSFKATNANEFTLQLNGGVNDPSELKLDLKRNGSAVTGYKTTWSDDKTTVVLTLDAKFDDEKWSVALGGLKNLDEKNSTAEVETKKETMEKIDLLTTSDTLPNNPGEKIRINFKATNQYGKQFSMAASDFDIYTSKGTQTPIGGEQAFYVTLPNDMKRDDHVSVTVLHKDSNKQVNKVFTIGDKSIISKVEAGDLLNGSGNKIEAIDANGYAYLDVKAYDQYGFRIEDKDALNSGVIVSITDNDLQKGNEGDSTAAFVDNAVGDEAADLKLRSVADTEKEFKVSLFANGSSQSVTKTIKVAAYKSPSKIDFGTYSYSLTNGDAITGDEATDNKMFIPILVKDAQGNQLTGQEIYDNRSKLTVFASGAITLASEPISNSGLHKGMIAIQSVDKKGSATITVQLKDDAAVRTEKTLNVNDERKADTLKFSTTPAKYMIAGADNELKLKLYDQYGGEMKYDSNNQYVVRYSLTANSGDAASLAATSLSSVQRTDETNNTSARKYVLNPTTVGTPVTQDLKLAHDAADKTVDSAIDKSFKFYAGVNAKAASYSFKATLYKQDNQGLVTIGDKKYVEVNNLSTTMEVLDPANVNNKLTYEAYLDKSNNTVLAAEDYLNAGTGAGGATNVYENYKGFAKEVKIRAKKDGSEAVKVPTNVVSISTSDSQVVDTATKTNWIAGGKAGKAKLTVLYYDGKKDIASSSIDVDSKNEGPVVSEIALKKSSKTVSQSDLQGNGLYVWDAKLAEKITIKDQYAGEFVAENAPGTLNEEAKSNDSMLVKANGTGYNNNEVLKVSFYISNIVGSNPSAIKVDPATGLIKYDGSTGDVTGFKVNVVAPSGVTAAFDVNVK